MKTNMGVFFGGASVEHEVAIISAVQAMNYIDRDKYEVTPVYITKSGEMFTSELMFQMESFKDIPMLLKKAKRISLLSKNEKCLIINAESGLFSKKFEIPVDIAFPIVHGTNCEDGSLQGYFETLRVPYIGCDVLSSAVGMDKAFFKNVIAAQGIPTLPCITFRSREWFLDDASIVSKIESQIGYPLIVKPANLGSSVGISKVKSADDLRDAIELACSFAEKILIEKAIENLREINCSCLGDADECEASVCEEPFMNDEILSYEDKYMSGSKSGKSQGMASVSRKCPAEISEEKANEIREITKAVFKALGCSGVSRIDYLMDTADNDKVYVNEINTIPGSLSFYLWEASGLKYKDMIDKLVEVAYKRVRQRKSTMFTIDTNLLSGAPSFGAKGTKGSKI